MPSTISGVCFFMKLYVGHWFLGSSLEQQCSMMLVTSFFHEAVAFYMFVSWNSCAPKMCFRVSWKTLGGGIRDSLVSVEHLLSFALEAIGNRISGGCATWCLYSLLGTSEEFERTKQTRISIEHLACVLHIPAEGSAKARDLCKPVVYFPSLMSLNSLGK